MWFNSTQREEPYQALTSRANCRDTAFRKDAVTGGAWLSSARVVRCLVKSSNERNPYGQLPARYGGDSDRTAEVNSEEGGDDVKSSCPLRPGLHTCYNGRLQSDAKPQGGAKRIKAVSVQIEGCNPPS